MLVHEPRLHQRDAELGALGSRAQIHPEALAAAGEIPWIEQIEVGLLQRDEADDAVDGAEARTHAHRAGRLFLDEDVHVAISGTARRAGGLDVAEILQVGETGLGRFEFDSVEHVSRLQRDFPADHLVLGLGVACDVHAAHLEAGTLSDAVGDIHPVRASVADVGSHQHVGVTARAVKAADHGDVLAHLLGRVGGITDEGQRRIEFLGFEYGHLAEADTRDRVAFALADRDHQIHAAVAHGDAVDAGATGAEIALVAVVIQDLVEIGVQLVRLETTGLGQPREPALFLHRHFLAEFQVGERIVAFESNLADLVLLALVDDENQVGQSRLAGRLRAVADRHVGVAVSLIVFLDVAPRLEDLLVAERAAGFDFRLLGQLLVGENRVSNKPHAAERRTRRHLGDQPHAVTHGLREEAHVVHQAGLIERLDVVIEILRAVGRAALGRHEVAQAGLVHRLCSLIADRHFGNVFPLEILRVQGPCESHKGKGGEGGELTHAARHEE